MTEPDAGAAPQNGVTRREMLQKAAGAGVGGLVLGGLGGYLAGSAAGPAAGPGAVAAGEPIRVVGIFPLSGVVAADGREMRNGTVMAIDEINEMGGLLGRPLEYIEIDDGDSFTDDIVNAFRRAVDVENPDVIISGYHLATGPEFDIVADAGRLYYNLNTQTAWVERYQSDPAKYWGIFQCDPTEAWYGIGFAQWADELVDEGKLSERTAVVLSADDPYGASIARHFVEEAQNLGWEIVTQENFTPGQVADWGPLLSRARSAEPGLIFTTTFSPADNAAMAQQFTANPADSVLYQQYGPSVPEYLDLAGEAANGVIWSTVLGLLTDDIANDFRARYEAKFGLQPGWANAGGNYDTVWTWAKGVVLAGDASDYEAVAQATEGVIHRGVTGAVRFVDHTGVQYPHQTNDPSLGQPQIIVQLQNREHIVIFPDPYTTGEFQAPPWFA